MSYPNPHRINRSTYNRRRAKGFTHDEALAYGKNVKYRTPIRFPDGRWFPNATVAAASSGLEPGIAHRRLRGGDDLTAAFRPAPKRNSPSTATPVTVGGRDYPSFNAAWRAIRPDISLTQIVRRHHDGWSDDAAFGLVPPPPGASFTTRTSYTVNGIPYKSAAALARAHGIPQEIVAERLRDGETPEQAVDLVPVDRTRYHLGDDRYDTLTEVALAHDISKQTLHVRLISTNDLYVACERLPAHGISITHPVYIRRRKQGFTKQEALAFPAHINTLAPVRLFGVTFPTVHVARNACDDATRHVLDACLSKTSPETFDVPQTETVCVWKQFVWCAVRTSEPRTTPAVTSPKMKGFALGGTTYYRLRDVAIAYGFQLKELETTGLPLDVRVGIAPGAPLEACDPLVAERIASGFTPGEARAFPAHIACLTPYRYGGHTFPNRDDAWRAMHEPAFRRTFLSAHDAPPTNKTGDTCLWYYMDWHARSPLA